MNQLAQRLARLVTFGFVVAAAVACSDDAPPGIVQTGGAPSGGSAPSSSGASSGGVGLETGGSASGVAGTAGGGAIAGGAGGVGGQARGGSAGEAVSGGSGGVAGSAGAAGTSGGSGGSGGVSATRDKATMVIRGSGVPTAGDKLMIGRIEAFGYQQVVTIKDADANAQAVAGSDLVVISSSAESGPLQDRLKDVPIPVLCIEDAEFKVMGMAAAGGHEDGITQLVVKTGGSPLVGGLMGTVTISSMAGELGWGTVAPSAVVGATMPNDPDHAVVFGYPAGAQMSTMVAPARRAGFAIREDLAANLNDDGIEVFDSILAWVAQ